MRKFTFIMILVSLISCKDDKKELLPYNEYLRCIISIDNDTVSAYDSINVKLSLINITNKKLADNFQCMFSLYDTLTKDRYDSYLDLSLVDLPRSVSNHYEFKLSFNSYDSICRVIKLNQLKWDDLTISTRDINSDNYLLHVTIFYPVDPSNPALGQFIESNDLNITKK